MHIHCAQDVDTTLEYYNETRGSFPVFFNPRSDTCETSLSIYNIIYTLLHIDTNKQTKTNIY